MIDSPPTLRRAWNLAAARFPVHPESIIRFAGVDVRVQTFESSHRKSGFTNIAGTNRRKSVTSRIPPGLKSPAFQAQPAARALRPIQ
jgi:hypothetical protein